MLKYLRGAIAGAVLSLASILFWLALNEGVLPSSFLFAIASAFSTERIQFFNLAHRSVWLQINATPTQATPVDLWATYYRVHQARNVPNGQPLLDKSGQPLGANLSTEDWCHAAMEGTVQVVDERGTLATYNYADHSDVTQVDCFPYFANLSAAIVDRVNKSRFFVSAAPYGYGTDKIPLVPYRTIAVDRDQIPLGSVLFIPEARGKQVTLPSGDRVLHDGFFYAADVGGAIQGNHIDVFLGTSPQNPFSFITSDPNTPFHAYLIQDPDITQALQDLHRK